MKKTAIFFILAVIAAAAFYLRSDLAIYYDRLTKRIADFEKESIEPLMSELQKQINAPPPLIGKDEAPVSVLIKAGVVKWTNSHRAENGLPALSQNARLDAAALAKAQDMFKNQYFDHVSPTGLGPADIVKNVGYEYIIVGENLAMGNFADDAALVRAWMDSPGHRANILNVKYTEIGVAVLKGAYQGKITWMAVQEFGLPASVCPSPSLELKEQIEEKKAELAALNGLVEARRQQIESGEFERGAEYNMAITEYNILVNRYNNSTTQVKNLVNNYNAQVNKYNACIK